MGFNKNHHYSNIFHKNGSQFRAITGTPLHWSFYSDYMSRCNKSWGRVEDYELEITG